jgi:ribose-phosphate pyrophosphokinase
MNDIKIIVGNSCKSLGNLITSRMKISQLNCILDKFSNGEIRVEIKESIRNKDIYIIQTGYSNENKQYNTSDYLVETLIIVDACKRSMAKSINLIMPYYPYSRQDKKDESRSPISAKLFANLLTKSGINRLVVMDLHSSQIQGFFDIPVDNIYSIKLVMEYFNSNIFEKMKNEEKEKKFIVVAPDAGSVKRTISFAKIMDLDTAILHKQRNYSKKNTIENSFLISNSDVKNKTAIICDDMCDTGGTLIKGIEELVKNGVKDVIVVITHGIFSGEAIERINNCKYIKEIIVSNSIPQDYNQKICKKIKLFHIENLLSKIIEKLGSCESISELF